MQARVPSAAELAIATRQPQPRPSQVTQALAERRLMRVWAMRRTLHLLPHSTSTSSAPAPVTPIPRLLPTATGSAAPPGWISPTVVTGSGVVGTWHVENDRLQVDLFSDAPAPTTGLLEAETDRLSRLLHTSLRLSMRLT